MEIYYHMSFQYTIRNWHRKQYKVYYSLFYQKLNVTTRKTIYLFNNMLALNIGIYPCQTFNEMEIFYAEAYLSENTLAP